MSRKKQQEGSMKTLRDLLAQPGNKKCLECDQRGPTYVDITIGSFVCTSCGGMLRGLNPPHRVKSISMTNFTPTEITFMENHGNEWCRAVYLAKYDEQSGAKPESKGDQNKLKQFMELKYEQKRWYESPTHQRKLMESVAARAKKNNENSKSISKPATNTVQAKLKPLSAPTKQAATNLLDGISFPSQPQAAVSSALPNQNPGSFSGFADFDRAFSELSTSQNNTSSQPDPFAAFQVSNQPIDFTNTTSKPSNGLSSATSTQDKSADRYAALLDLDLAFNKTDNLLTKNEPFFSMSSNSVATSGLSQPTNVGLYSGMPTQQMSNSTFGTNPTLSGHNSLAPEISSQNFGTAVNWNASFPTYPSTNPPTYPSTNQPTYASTNQPTYPSTNQQSYPSTNQPTYPSSYQSNPLPVASATNPFFSTQQQAPPPAQNWSNQFQMQQPARPVNPSGLPSTNPFNIGGPAVPTGNAFNMSQASNPVQTSNNPFLFS